MIQAGTGLYRGNFGLEHDMKNLITFLIFAICASAIGQSLQWRNANIIQFGSNNFNLSIKGSGLTNLNADNLTSGTVSESRLGSSHTNWSLYGTSLTGPTTNASSGGSNWVGGLYLWNPTTGKTINLTNGAINTTAGIGDTQNGVTGVISSNKFIGDGSLLTSLNASSLASGTVSDARLSAPLQSLSTNNASSLTNVPVRAIDELLTATGSFGWTSGPNGTGSSSGIGTGIANHNGVWSLVTGTTTTGIGCMRTDATSCLFGSSTMFATFRFQIPSALSDNTDNYQVVVGFIDSCSGAATDGAAILYSNGTNSGAFVGFASNNSTRTYTNSSVTASAAAWYDVIVSGTSSAVLFSISSDGGVTWTTVGPVTSNIPSSTGREFGIGVRIAKQAGTNSITMLVDRAIFQQ